MRIRFIALSATGAVLVAAAFAGSASAATSVTWHDSFPAAGATFTCGSSVLTSVTGVIDTVMHENADGRGLYHYSGTDTAHGVTVVDADGATYRLEGASSFSGTSRDAEGLDNVVTTDGQEFTITSAGGGRFGKVDIVNHLSPNGRVRTVDFGTCTGSGGM
jgi:hypothetical protein